MEMVINAKGKKKDKKDKNKKKKSKSKVKITKEFAKNANFTNKSKSKSPLKRKSVTKKQKPIISVAKFSVVKPDKNNSKETKTDGDGDKQDKNEEFVEDRDSSFEEIPES